MNKEKIRSVILDLYNQDKSIVNDEVRLLEQVWLRLGWSYNRSLYENMCVLPRAETVSRRRRELHQEGLIEYSEKADKERYEAFKNERESAAVSWLKD